MITIEEVELATPDQPPPRITVLGAVLTYATWPPLLGFAVLLVAAASLGLAPPQTPRPPQGGAAVRYSAGTDGIPWNCTRVDREQNMASWTVTRLGIPRLVLISCSPV